MKKEDIFGDIVYSYTSKQAEEDGILLDITKLNKDWEKGIFNYVTLNLLSQGYLKDGKVSIPNLLDLLNQCLFIIKKKSKNFTRPDYFFSGKVEFPNGDRKTVFMGQNETGKFTVMLPEDR
jgi:hypothetical protein